MALLVSRLEEIEPPSRGRPRCCGAASPSARVAAGRARPESPRGGEGPSSGRAPRTAARDHKADGGRESRSPERAARFSGSCRSTTSPCRRRSCPGACPPAASTRTLRGAPGSRGAAGRARAVASRGRGSAAPCPTRRSSTALRGSGPCSRRRSAHRSPATSRRATCASCRCSCSGIPPGSEARSRSAATCRRS